MINNRQGGGRRRGRGGQRGQSVGGQPGNRQDNRQRGNAAQLLEKYKNMARDAQLSGDRVQTEYYLQFADHYFRILSENRARFEDQRRHRDDDLDEDENESDDEMLESADDQSDVIEPRRERADRGDRGERFNRRDRGRDRQTQGLDEEGETASRANGGETIPFDILPPAIARDGNDDGDLEETSQPKRPRRRARSAPATDGDEEIAPAA